MDSQKEFIKTSAQFVKVTKERFKTIQDLFKDPLNIGLSDKADKELEELTALHARLLELHELTKKIEE